MSWTWNVPSSSESGNCREWYTGVNNFCGANTEFQALQLVQLLTIAKNTSPELNHHIKKAGEELFSTLQNQISGWERS